MNYKQIVVFIFTLLVFASCATNSPLDYALEQAGSNRPELERVLDHYKSDPEKLAAAEFLIENMPAHISYRDSTIFFLRISKHSFTTMRRPTQPTALWILCATRFSQKCAATAST